MMRNLSKAVVVSTLAVLPFHSANSAPLINSIQVNFSDIPDGFYEGIELDDLTVDTLGVGALHVRNGKIFSCFSGDCSLFVNVKFRTPVQDATFSIGNDTVAGPPVPGPLDVLYDGTPGVFRQTPLPAIFDGNPETFHTIPIPNFQSRGISSFAFASGGTPPVFGPDGNGGFTITDPGKFEQYGLTSLTYQSTPTLFLDFDGGMPRDVGYDKSLLTGKEFPVYRPGSEAPISYSFWNDVFKEQVRSETQKVFDQSNIAINVTSSQPTSGDYLTVNYAPITAYSDDGLLDLNGNGVREESERVLGQAYNALDDGRVSGAGVDRFDLYKSGNSVVYVFEPQRDDTRDLQAAFIAELTAHEAGHAYGLRHINPSESSAAEVLDYHYLDPSPAFFNRPTNIVEPPVNGEGDVKSDTHNPQYHLQRYLLGQSDDDIQNSGLSPGSYDTEGALFSELRLFIESLSVEVNDLSIGIDTPAQQAVDIPNVLAEGGYFSEIVTANVEAGSTFIVSLIDDFEFDLFGYSPNSVLQDIIFSQSPIPQQAEFSTAENSGSGYILRWNEAVEQYSTIGEFKFDIQTIGLLMPDGSIATRLSKIPEPKTNLFFFVLLFYLFFYRKRNI